MDNEKLFRAATAPCGSDCRMPRALVLFSHPDDESIALGARLPRYHRAGFICATDGAPLDGRDAAAHGYTIEEYRAARRAELERVFRLAGIDRDNLRETGIPDQHGAFELSVLVQHVIDRCEDIRPEVIVTHAYEGGHPDHDACAFAARACISHLRTKTSLESAPLVIEAPFYHQGPAGVETARFLEDAGPQQQAGATTPLVLHLSSDEISRKRQLLACHETQRETLESFPRDIESFRIAPVYDFTEPPHSGELLYERQPWGITGEQFREQVQNVSHLLRRDGLLCSSLS